jgi:hypothetical protein
MDRQQRRRDDITGRRIPLGPPERPPFEVTHHKQDLKQALQQREARLRQSSANDREEYAPGQFTDEEDEDTTPWGRKSDQRTWYTQRWGDLEEHISDEITREGLVTSGYVVKHRGRAHDRDSHHVTNRRTPSPEARAAAEGSSPTAEVDADEVTLGAYGDRPLEVRSGVVAPSPYYVIIDGGATVTASRRTTDTKQERPSRSGTAPTEQSITCERAQSRGASHRSPAQLIQRTEHGELAKATCVNS